MRLGLRRFRGRALKDSGFRSGLRHLVLGLEIKALV